MPTEDYTQYLDPKVLNKVSRLELRARLIVEGFIAGQHKSPYQGFSVEFASHREYVAGDDIRHIDWKVFGKSDRFYIKQYEEETNFRAHLLLDASESMAYASQGAMTKLDYGATMTAALAYLIIQQQDAAGLVVFDKDVRAQLPVSSSPAHLRAILSTLAGTKPGEKTKIASTLHAMAEKLSRKGLVVVVSDLFDDPQEILLGLQHLRHKKHEVILFHLMDRDEVDFPFQQLTRFVGLEGIPPILTQPRALRQAYLDEVTRFREALRKGCRGYNIDYVPVTTDQTLDVVLTAYLATRAGAKARSARSA
ncbi:MAG: DUF58 domain-containing protein [Planctomycetes bacterium]|nr:DUF58 domain-containing protein [Planctomycetota bacterium]